MPYELLLTDTFDELKNSKSTCVVDGDNPTTEIISRVLFNSDSEKLRRMVKTDLKSIVKSMENAAKKGQWKYVLLVNTDHNEGQY